MVPCERGDLLGGCVLQLFDKDKVDGVSFEEFVSVMATVEAEARANPLTKEECVPPPMRTQMGHDSTTASV